MLSSVDATEESGRLGRLINHCREAPNTLVKTVLANGFPCLYLIAARDLKVGEEVFFDYGDRRKDIVAEFKWLGH